MPMIMAVVAVLDRVEFIEAEAAVGLPNQQPKLGGFHVIPPILQEPRIINTNELG